MRTYARTQMIARIQIKEADYFGTSYHGRKYLMTYVNGILTFMGQNCRVKKYLDCSQNNFTFFKLVHGL